MYNVFLCRDLFCVDEYMTNILYFLLLVEPKNGYEYELLVPVPTVAASTHPKKRLETRIKLSTTQQNHSQPSSLLYAHDITPSIDFANNTARRQSGAIMISVVDNTCGIET